MGNHFLRTLILPLLLIFLSSGLYAQEETGNKVADIQQDLSEYFSLPREQVYLHLNKSVYIQGETLWFKGYVYDMAQKKPFAATRNIEVGLYDREGGLVTKGLFKGGDGHTRGQFALDSLFSPGDYYIEATTNWSRNFKEDHGYVQRIKVLGDRRTRKGWGTIKRFPTTYSSCPRAGTWSPVWRTAWVRF